MQGEYTVALSKLISEFNLETVFLPPEQHEFVISSTEVNRPGLHLTGFYEYFDVSRIQITGKMEFAYLANLTPELRLQRLSAIFERKIPALIVTSGLEIFPEILESAQSFGIPLLRTQDTTSGFMSSLISYLNVELAPRITRHGALVEIYGEGVLILGESGVGKSETAIELVKRGHRLIADDAVEIRRVSNKTLVGSSPENIRHFMELRGIGIINARRLFGIGAVNITEKLDMVIKLELWDQAKAYDRMGIDTEYTSILGVNVRSLTIPVKPGRNLAVILEVAAMNNRQRKLGYNAAQELLQNIGMTDVTAIETTTDWEAF